MSSGKERKERSNKLVEAGDIAQALQVLLDGMGSSLRVGGRRVGIVEEPDRRGRINAVPGSDEEPLFYYDLSERGIIVADGQSRELGEVARGMHGWLEVGINIDELRRSALVSEPDCSADTEKRVKEREWQILEDEGAGGGEYPEEMVDLQPLVVAAQRSRKLQALFPYTSLGRLCLSRNTVYPFDSDGLPSVVPVDERYAVFNARHELVDEVDAETAVQLLIDQLVTKD